MNFHNYFAKIRELQNQLTEYEKQIIYLCAILPCFLFAHLAIYPVIMAEPYYICHNSLNKSQTCSYTDACLDSTTYTLSKSSIQSIPYEFNLTCNARDRADLIGSIIFIGKTLGFIYYTFYAINNKRTLIELLIPTLLIQGVTLMMHLIIPNVFFLYILTGMVYFFNAGSFTLVLALASEVFIRHSDMKDIIIHIVSGTSVFSGILMSVLGYFISDNWRVICGIFIGIPTIVIYIMFKDLSQKNEQKTEKNENFCEIQQKSNKNQKIGNIWNLFTYGSLRTITICLIGMEVTVEFIYYGVHMTVESVAGNIFLNTAVQGLADLAAAMQSIYFCKKFNRKDSLTIAFLINFFIYSFVFIFLYSEHGHNQSLILIMLNVFFALFGRYLAGLCFEIHLQWLSELACDAYRPQLIGLLGVVGSLLPGLIPQFYTFFKNNGLSPYVGFGFFNIAGMCFIYFLPETKDNPISNLPVEDLKFKDKEMSLLTKSDFE